MTNSDLYPAGSDTSDNSHEIMRAISAWMDAPPPLTRTEQLESLRKHLATIHSSRCASAQQAEALDLIYTRSASVVNKLLPSLIGIPLPIPRKTRQLIRNMQRLLSDLAASLSDLVETTKLPQTQDLALWRSMHALALHLLISNLASSPAEHGIWQQLHQSFETAHRLEAVRFRPESTTITLQSIYFSAILLGCAQPDSFTSREIDFIANYLERFPDQMDWGSGIAANSPSAFWITPERDTPAIACSRKAAPPETSTHYFSCNRLAIQLKEQLAALEAGEIPQKINLPDFAATPAGRGVLRRLISYWGKPGKRRFTRRRQNCRAVLCTGLQNLWHLFQSGGNGTIESSSWMITNQSPDGYALMHLSGKTSEISVGDVAAVRNESEENWQICIVRRMLSESQEHIELGLQTLATHATPALLARPSHIGNTEHLPVLVLPEIPPLRPSETLVVSSGALEPPPQDFILVIDKGNIEVREVKSTRLEEQNSRIETFSIKRDSLTC